MIWRLADAKNKLSEVVDRAINEGPQRISRRGQVVVVILEDEFDRLRGQTTSFTAYLLHGPDLSDLDLARPIPDAGYCMARARRNGTIVPPPGGLIAATALGTDCM